MIGIDHLIGRLIAFKVTNEKTGILPEFSYYYSRFKQFTFATMAMSTRDFIGYTVTMT